MATRERDAPHAEALSSARILVIGGTSGVGFAVASGAIAAGGRIFVTSSSQDKVSNTISRLKALYPNGKFAGTAANLSQADTLEANVQQVLDEAVEFAGGPLDHIVITAGSSFTPVMLEDVTPATAINTKEHILRVLMPLMVAKFIAKFPGRYVNASSKSSLTLTCGVFTKRPLPGMSTVLIIGAALEGLSRGLAVDLKPIRVNVVTVGFIDTEMHEGLPKEARHKFAKASLVDELGTPWDCAEAYLFFMRNKFATGQDIVNDGGALLLSGYSKAIDWDSDVARSPNT